MYNIFLIHQCHESADRKHFDFPKECSYVMNNFFSVQLNITTKNVPIKVPKEVKHYCFNLCGKILLEETVCIWTYFRVAIISI